MSDYRSALQAAGDEGLSTTTEFTKQEKEFSKRFGGVYSFIGIECITCSR